MECNLDYYLLKAVRKHPIKIVVDENYGRENGIEFLYGDYRVKEEHLARLKVVGKTPTIDEMADHYSIAGSGAIFSPKIADIILKEKIKGIQLVRSIIESEDGTKIDNYRVANIYQSFNSFDEEATTCDFISKVTGAWVGIKKTSIKPDLLIDIPLEDRLVYKAKENSSFCLYHKIIVDKIMSSSPTGVRFIPLVEWYDGI